MGDIPDYIWFVTLFHRPVHDEIVQLQKVDTFILIASGPQKALEYAVSYLFITNEGTSIIDEMSVKRQKIDDDWLIISHENLV